MLRAEELDCQEPECNGLDCPPGFEGVFGKNESVQSIGEFFVKEAQTHLLVSASNLQGDDCEVVTPWEENLIKARVSWDLGKVLGLRVSNEIAMIEALAKVPKCQDFVMPRRKGHPRMKKGDSKE